MAGTNSQGDPVIDNEASHVLNELRKRSESDRELFATLQNELHRIARSKMRFERPDHTLQASALVNELFIKIFHGKASFDFVNDTKVAVKYLSRAMEQILNDHADAYRAKKRGGANRRRVPLDEQQAQQFLENRSWVQPDSALLIKPEQSEQIIGVREALKILRATSPRQAHVTELQFYAGLTQEEIASVLDVSIETVKLDTKKAKAFLKLHLTKRAE